MSAMCEKAGKLKKKKGQESERQVSSLLVYSCNNEGIDWSNYRERKEIGKETCRWDSE